MSEIINLIKKNPDSHIYAEAVEILSSLLGAKNYSFILQVWNHEIPQDTKYPKVLISTSDEIHGIPDQVEDESFVHIFKQYAPMEHPNHGHSVVSVDKVSPIPLCNLEGVVNQNIPINEREYDWSWMGQYDPFTRTHFRVAVDSLEKERPQYKNRVLWYQGWNNGSSVEDYTETINNTKVAVVPIGSGSLESFRFFEAMMCGCVVLNTALPDVMFYNVSPHLRMDGWTNLNEAMDRILSRPDEMEHLSKQAKEWYKDFCTPQSIAEYMYKKLESK
jgi:hypothetical protein|tara:strand:- start:3944 stop:4768 length:825 start_codon:yes stop_codon:yes gene_type:complete